MYVMLAMHSSMGRDNWAELSPIVQLARNTSFSATMHETPYFSMFGRQARLPIDVTLGVPHVGPTTDTDELAQNTGGENLRFAFGLARGNLTERANKQAAKNAKLPQYLVLKTRSRSKCWFTNRTETRMDRTQNYSCLGEDHTQYARNCHP